MYKIVITDTNLGGGSEEARELAGSATVERFDAKSEDEVIEVAAGADGLLVQWAPITAKVLDALPEVRCIVRYGIGLDNIDVHAAKQRGVAVSNVDDYCLNEVADHAASAIYAHNRRLTVSARSVAERGWTTAGIDQPLPPALDPVGIAGYGRIGRELERRVSALGFPVHVWDAYTADLPEHVTQHATLAGLAEAVNHLSLHVPTNADTMGVVNIQVLKALGPLGHLVNTARGALVDEDALLAALEAEELGFASLDVLSSEPPVDVALQLAAHPRVLVTPHTAYLSTQSLPQLRLRAAQILADLLKAADDR